jgi:hypothetical protein
MKNLLTYGEMGSPVNEAETNTYQKYSSEAQQDLDHFNMIVMPKMKAAGFIRVNEPAQKGQSPYGTGYFCYPDHESGVNLFLSTSLYAPWKYVVYEKGNRNVREFGWETGTDAEVKKAALDAVNYAIALKRKYEDSI